MIRCFLIVIFSILSFTLRAQDFFVAEELPHTCATSEVDRIDVEKLFENLRTENPALYRIFQLKDTELQKFNAANNAMQQFWAVKITGENIKPEDFYTLQATLRQEGNSIRIWVEDASWNAAYVTQTEVDIIFQALTVSTPSGSIDPGKGILEIDTTLFGQPPDKAGDGVTNFLILDIKDTYDPQAGNKTFVAGFFFPNDQTNGTQSNKMDLLYIDSFPGIYFEGERRTKTVLGTTSHELQHLIHYTYDRFEDNWVNEGLSELASTACGYGIGVPSLFLQDPNHNLTGWSGLLEDYSRVGLWALYISEQFGYEFTRRLTQNPSHGITGFNNALTLSGYGGLHFVDVFRDWTIANYVNDVNSDPRYGYRHEDARGLRAAVSEEVSNFPQLIDVSLDRYAAQYYRLGGADTLEIEFFSELAAGVLARQTASISQVIPLRQNPFIYPGFNNGEDFALILNNINNPLEYEFCAYAPLSLTSIDLGYDDGNINISLVNSGIAANRFVVPQSGLSLNRIEFFNMQANTPFKIHFYSSSVNLPGSDIINPIDTMLAVSYTWFELNLPEEISGLNAGKVIFVGIEADSFAYDSDSDGNGKSYFYTSQNGWDLLSDYQAGGNDLTGAWMIRAGFRGGLTASGPRGCSATPIFGTKIDNLFPNPSRGSITIEAAIAAPGEMILEIYDLLGQKVSEYKQTLPGAAKSSLVSWNNIQTSYGLPLSSGIYFLRIEFFNAETQRTETLENRKLVIMAR